MSTLNLKRRPRVPLFLLLGLLMGMKGYAQHVVSGTVEDGSLGGPLFGATVYVKGTSTGTTTDMEGQFKLDVGDPNSTIVFSYIGYVTQEIPVEGKTVINLTMSEDVQVLEDLVVVGYSTEKEEDLTGAVNSVSNESFKDAPVTRVEQALQGRTPGVQVNTNSGAPGTTAKVRIRGAGSMMAGNSPLIVVDGVVMAIALNEINPNDIESMTVLKDASAAAIYGSRAANGVIVITTKQGLRDTSEVVFTTNLGVSRLARRYDLMNAGDFATLVGEYRPSWFDEDEIAAFQGQDGTDWQDAIFQDALMQDYQLGVRGGSGNTRYYVSANYVDQDGIVKTTNMKRWSTRLNMSTKVNDKLKLDYGFMATRLQAHNNDDNGTKTGPLMGALFYSPTTDIYDSTGEYVRRDLLAAPNATNPFMLVNERNYDFFSMPTMANAKMNYEFFEGLSLDVIMGVNHSSWGSASFINRHVSASPTQETSAHMGRENIFSWQQSNVLTYKKDFKEIHSLTAQGIVESSKYNYAGQWGSGSDISPESVGYNNMFIANEQSTGTYQSGFSLRSYAARVTYGLDNRYLITATTRADGTSKFQGKNKWGVFPSVAAGWKISEEKFMKDSKFIDNMKLRASWGITGNQEVNAYATIATIGTTITTFGNNNNYAGSTINGVDNSGLKWETTTQTNIGLDATVWDERLTIHTDIYSKNTTDILHGVSIPSYYGGGTINQNIGEMVNKGIEFAIDAAIVDNL